MQSQSYRSSRSACRRHIRNSQRKPDSCHGNVTGSRNYSCKTRRTQSSLHHNLRRGRNDTACNSKRTTTYGVGEMIRHAIQKGCRRFLIGIGGSATNDGGIGMLQALGYDFLTPKRNPVAPGATGLKELSFISDTHVLPELKECEFHIACDVTNPLCGETARCSGCNGIKRTIFYFRHTCAPGIKRM